MNAKEKFITMYNWMSEEARRELLFKAYGNHPLSINVIFWEVNNNTERGKKLLESLGFKDDVLHAKDGGQQDG